MAEKDNRSDKNERGFTLIELMVATVIFSLVMIVLTYGVISISRSYYKGITVSQTQNAARNIASSLTQAIEFDGNYIALPPSGNLGGFCIGNKRFSYLLGYQLAGTYSTGLVHTAAHSLVEDTPGSCSSGSLIQDLANNNSLPGIELMGKNMRLANLTINQQGSTNLYQIDVRVVYGDEDLLNNPTGTDASCKGQSGDQFCATSELSTTVARRVE